MMQHFCALSCDAGSLCFVFEHEERERGEKKEKSTVSSHRPGLNIILNSELDHECSGSVSQSLEWTTTPCLKHVRGASFIAGWLGWKGLCASFRAAVVFSCGLLVKWDWLLGSSGQKPAGDHYYCWKNIAPCHRMVAPHAHTEHACKHMHTVHRIELQTHLLSCYYSKSPPRNVWHATAEGRICTCLSAVETSAAFPPPPSRPTLRFSFNLNFVLFRWPFQRKKGIKRATQYLFFFLSMHCLYKMIDPMKNLINPQNRIRVSLTCQSQFPIRCQWIGN